jgi:hypothetical protein
MSDTKEYPEAGSLPDGVELTVREGATEPERRIAELSVAAMFERSNAAVAQSRAVAANIAELTESIDRPLRKLIQDDHAASDALEKLRGLQLLHGDDIEDLEQGTSGQLTDGPASPEQGVDTFASLNFAPPYHFQWSFHNGHAPHKQNLVLSTGAVSLDARSGHVDGGASGDVKAHCGFGVVLPRTDVESRRFPHAVINPGRFARTLKTVGVGSNATTEGGFDLAVFEDGRFLVLADRKLWRKRIGAGEEDAFTSPTAAITGPELAFTMRPGHEYSFNAGIWVYTDRTNGIGAAAAVSQLVGTISRMWVF